MTNHIDICYHKLVDVVREWTGKDGELRQVWYCHECELHLRVVARVWGWNIETVWKEGEE